MDFLFDFPVILWATQCEGEDWYTDCTDGSVCVVQSDYYGQCMPPELDGGALCGQNGDTENWEHVCKSGFQCVQKDGKDMRCVAVKKHKKSAKKSHHKKSHKKQATTWQQCEGEDWYTDCTDGSVCVVQSDYYGQCMPPELDGGALCGQNGDTENWEHVCKSGFQCVQKDGKDMRCVAVKKHKKSAKKSHKH